MKNILKNEEQKGICTVQKECEDRVEVNIENGKEENE